MIWLRFIHRFNCLVEWFYLIMMLEHVKKMILESRVIIVKIHYLYGVFCRV